MYKLLYVEDEPFLAKIVKDSLETRGYEIVHVADGAEVVKAFRDQSPDLCLLDVMLPNIDGFELAGKIRDINQDVPILFLTAKDQSDDVVTGFKQGGNDYVRKPFSMEELILRIENLLKLTNNKKSENVEELTIRRYKFFPFKMQLEYEGKVTNLSHRETEIIKLLCNHMNKRLERKEIMQAVWGNDSFFNSRNLDVYIKKIRDHFAADEKIKILTLKGVGYHFLVE
jgi:DNA-binding response OmpR family regulator